MSDAAEAAPITVTGSPVSLSLADAAGTEVTWDVDGGGAEFSLHRYNSGAPYIFFASFSGKGGGLVGPTFYTDNVQALSRSFNVGPTLANGLVWGTNVGGGYRYRNAMGSYGGGPLIGYDFNFGFVPGDNFFGFRFYQAGQLHYGFGRINFDLTNGVVSILDWVYESEPNTAVHVNDIEPAVPEPSSLTLLALGAGGLMALRRRRKAAMETVEN